MRVILFVRQEGGTNDSRNASSGLQIMVTSLTRDMKYWDSMAWYQAAGI